MVGGRQAYGDCTILFLGFQKTKDATNEKNRAVALDDKGELSHFHGDRQWA